MERGGVRPGELTVTPDPGALSGDARVVFIGRIRTPWRTLADCPKNVRTAREKGGTARLEIEAPYRPGLAGLEGVSHLVVLYWMDRSRRDVIVQIPRHAGGPRGVFSLRSPARPNPIAMGVVPLLSLDLDAGQLEIGMLDCLDGTPLLDVKPYVPSVDAIAYAAFD
ncbi:tRNA (N6-threonylcarbamoyladenosine(37)-N6)-methyltransferase TrmO [Pseudoxanthobacter sp. M-2]|uniref:tRNA (N6-threonylcarbamoyladenosine(37)-N6)-methyltransferase TrmO n=1 Tax=Pseudoxanthobacter sp. M-2 TaxID=3078754 RepID=UPI0038FC44E1